MAWVLRRLTAQMAILAIVRLKDMTEDGSATAEYDAACGGNRWLGYCSTMFMNNIQKLELMDKVQRELKDLEQSQVAVLKKVSQIAAHNITLGAPIIDEKLPDLQDHIDSNVQTITEILEAFHEYRENFFSENKMPSQLDPTA
jgi:hypothetical protein